MFCRHSFGWPRRVDGWDIQTCTRCDARKKSKIQFTGKETAMPGMEHLKTPFPPIATCEETRTEMLARLESLRLEDSTVYREATRQ